jgi:hypothetical protein
MKFTEKRSVWSLFCVILGICFIHGIRSETLNSACNAKESAYGRLDKPVHRQPLSDRVLNRK